MKTPRAWTCLLAAALSVALLSACAEKQPRTVPKGEKSFNGAPGAAPLRERTLNQGESSRD